MAGENDGKPQSDQARSDQARSDQAMWADAVERTSSGISSGLKGAARSLARSLGANVPAPEEYAPAIPFAKHDTALTSHKHRELAAMFGLPNPFYHVHEGRLGATTKSNGRELINFASYDYLGLNQEPSVAEATKRAVEEMGTSVSASRLVAGERALHQKLEKALADFYETEDCIVYVSGHATNVSTIGALMKDDDLIVHDSLMHNSGIMGARLSRAATLPFKHNNLADLEKVLIENRKKYKNCLIVTEGLYSMDGDFPDLPRLIEIKKKYGCWLMVDEAHSLGVLGKTGRGVGEHYGIDFKDVDIWMGTLSKTLGSCGGYICGNRDLVDLLKYHSPGFVYSVGLSPPGTAAALAALEVLVAEPERVAQLQANGKLFLEEAKKAGLDTMTSAGYSVVPILIGCSVRSVRMTDRLLARGLNVLPIISPAVPMKAARLRFFITSKHTGEQIREAVKVTAEELANVNKKQGLVERATLAVVARTE